MGPTAAARELLGVTPTVVRRLRGAGNDHWSLRCGSERYVLRKFGPSQDEASIAWEQRVVCHLAERDWPVATAIAGPATIDSGTWMVMRRLPGRLMATTSASSFTRGQLLARLHRDLESLDIDQRPGWTRHDAAARQLPAFLDDLPAVVSARFPDRPGLADRMVDFTHRTLEAIRTAGFEELSVSVVHGDLMPWNLLVERRAVIGILDFEKSHVDYQATDVAFATWGGRHEDVVAGYRSVAPATFTTAQLELLWAATCLAALQRHLQLRREGVAAGGLGWAVEHALRPWGA